MALETRCMDCGRKIYVAYGVAPYCFNAGYVNCDDEGFKR